MGFTTPRIRINRALADGTAVVLDLKWNEFPLTVFANPVSGDTVTVSYSCDGGNTYTAWSAGSVTVYTESVFDAPVTHLKFQRTAGSGTTSTYGVC